MNDFVLVLGPSKVRQRRKSSLKSQVPWASLLRLSFDKPPMTRGRIESPMALEISPCNSRAGRGAKWQREPCEASPFDGGVWVFPSLGLEVSKPSELPQSTPVAYWAAVASDWPYSILNEEGRERNRGEGERGKKKKMVRW